MTNIRRFYSAGSAVFITAVCYQRQPLLADRQAKELLLEVVREVKNETGFAMHAYVILNDHFHLLIKPIDGDFTAIMRSIKARFAHRNKRRLSVDGKMTAWQKRFWDHVIRNETDWQRHLDYIHYNPVKHGYVSSPAEYPYSTFNRYFDKGSYIAGWGVNSEPDNLTAMKYE